MSNGIHSKPDPSHRCEGSCETALLEAVRHKQRDVVSFLLRNCTSRLTRLGETLCSAILENPDPDILQQLLTYDPSFGDTQFDRSRVCFFVEACAYPPDKIVPILNVLLDNNVNLESYLTVRTPLAAAIWGAQPIAIIDRLIRRGEVVTSLVISAITDVCRFDVLKHLFEHNFLSEGLVVDMRSGKWLHHVKDEKVEAQMRDMFETYDVERTAKAAEAGRKSWRKRWYQVFQFKRWYQIFRS